jgi:hypothetical protein
MSSLAQQMSINTHITMGVTSQKYLHRADGWLSLNPMNSSPFPRRKFIRCGARSH